MVERVLSGWRSVAAAVSLALLCGCSAMGAGPPGSATPTVPPVTVTTDVRFAAKPPDAASWTEPELDVYAPGGAKGAPLVVFFPAHSLTKDDSPAYAQFAAAVAARGAVVVVANWSQREDADEVFTDTRVFDQIAGLGQSVAGCAVSYAVAHAGEYGADPSHLVLAGELQGANTASMLALGTPAAYPACAATATWKATGLVAVNDDWLALFPYFDRIAGTAVTRMSPWSVLDVAPKIPVALVVTKAGADGSARCGRQDVAWMASRDPTGAMRRRLAATGAYGDGCVDLADQAAAMAAELTDRGLTAEVVRLADPATESGGSGDVRTLGPSDLALLTDAVLGRAA